VRSDYISYVAAVICFLFAAIVFATAQAPLGDTIWAALTVILAILGLIIAGFGYSQRPKEAKLPPPTPPSALEPTPTPVQQVQQAETAVSTPTPITAPSPEETKKPQEEIEPAKKAVRRRRKKA